MNASRKTATNWLSAIGYRLILGIFLGITVLSAHADSGRAQVESFMDQFTKLIEEKGGTPYNDKPEAYISAWPQFSQKLLLAKKKDPAKVLLNFSGATKWAVVSSTPTETTVVVIVDRFLREPSKHPQEQIGYRYVFETRKIPGEGWKIVVDAGDNMYMVIRSSVPLSWSEFVSNGYKNAIDRVYMGKTSEQSIQTATVCNSVYPGKTGTRAGPSLLSTDVNYVIRYVNKDRGTATIEATNSGQLNMNRGEMKEVSCGEL